MVELQAILIVFKGHTDVEPVLEGPLLGQFVVENDIPALLSLDEFGLLVLSSLIH